MFVKLFFRASLGICSHRSFIPQSFILPRSYVRHGSDLWAAAKLTHAVLEEGGLAPAPGLLEPASWHGAVFAEK